MVVSRRVRTVDLKTGWRLVVNRHGASAGVNFCRSDAPGVVKIGYIRRLDFLNFYIYVLGKRRADSRVVRPLHSGMERPRRRPAVTPHSEPHESHAPSGTPLEKLLARRRSARGSLPFGSLNRSLKTDFYDRAAKYYSENVDKNPELVTYWDAAEHVATVFRLSICKRIDAQTIKASISYRITASRQVKDVAQQIRGDVARVPREEKSLKSNCSGRAELAGSGGHLAIYLWPGTTST